MLMADLADRAAGDRLVDEAWALWGGLDAWLHIAGADTLTGAAAKLPFDAKLDLLWSVDVAATIRLCRAVGRLMDDQGSGAIVTMGWDQAETGMEGDSGELFAATKGAIMAFTRSLALEPGAGGPRQCAGAGLDQDGLGRRRFCEPGTTACSRKPRWPAGARPKTSRRSLAFWSARRPRFSPARSSASTAGPCGERGRAVAEADKIQASPGISSSPAGWPNSRCGRCSMICLPRPGSSAEVAVLPISVAALMTPQMGRAAPRGSRWNRPRDPARILPRVISARSSNGRRGVRVEPGPEDLRDLPRHFGHTGESKVRLRPVRHRNPRRNQPCAAPRP